MARRPNTLLADLTVRPTAAMTTKDQLDQLFRAEIEGIELERMMTLFDDIVFATRRVGLVDDVRGVEADIEVSSAYRLIQLSGPDASSASASKILVQTPSGP